MNTQRDARMIRNSAARRKTGGALATTPLMVAAMLSAGAGHAPAHTEKAPDTHDRPAWTRLPQAAPSDDADSPVSSSWTPAGKELTDDAQNSDAQNAHAQDSGTQSPSVQSTDVQATDAPAAVTRGGSAAEGGTALGGGNTVSPLAGGGSDYTVKSGDTVWSVARKLHLPVAQILKANNLTTHTLIFPGQKLRLSGNGPTAETAGSVSKTYTVEGGDSLYAIALQFHTTVKALQKANDMGDSTMITVGQKLKTSGNGSGSASDSGSKSGKSGSSSKSGSSHKTATTYTVKSGDTLFGIALKFHTTTANLQRANNMGDSTTVQTGQTLHTTGTSHKKLPHMAKSFSGRTYPDETNRAARINKDTLQRSNLPSTAAMQQMVADVARSYGVDPALAQAVAYQESGFHMSVVSPANAIGVMQVIPASGRWASGLAGRKLNLLSPRDNVTAGVVILKYLTTHTKKDAKAIAGYYQGLGSVQKNGVFSDTRRYVNSVQTLKSRFQ